MPRVLLEDRVKDKQNVFECLRTIFIRDFISFDCDKEFFSKQNVTLVDEFSFMWIIHVRLKRN